MRHQILIFFILSTFLCQAFVASTSMSAAQTEGIDLALAQKYFEEAAAICGQDKGQLWEHSLCGPLIFFEPRTRMVVANQPDREGRLTKRGEVFVGRLPEEENAANTATTWAGVRWSMIFWQQLGEDRYERARLMTHESFHRVQEEIGLPLSNPSNNHLDTLNGRLWLQLEWRALHEALTQRGTERKRAVTDALTFRLYRRTLFQEAATEERALEMNEGLAEYTGVRLSGRVGAELKNYMAERLKRANERPTFTRSFAYESGPAYGLLLDEAAPGWRHRLKSTDDFGALLQKAFSLRLPENLKAEAERRASIYGGDELRAAEAKREDERRARLNDYRARLVDGPLLILPLTDSVNYSFDPNTLVPLDGLGTVYPRLRVTDAWGILEVNGGALMSREKNRPTRITIPATADVNARPLQGDGWTLRLNEGWKLVATERKGDFELRKE